jgi:hypothetical protein
MMKQHMIKLVSSLAIVSLASTAWGQVIDFETMPCGSATIERQPIFNQYENDYDVTFKMLDRDTGEFVGYPYIVRKGEPQTGFYGCAGEDTPLPGQGVGESYLSTGSNPGGGNQYDLLIEYGYPVSAASGVLIDLDYQSSWLPDPREEWQITARNPNGLEIESFTMRAPNGPTDPNCDCVDCGPGDGLAIGWQFDIPGGQIKSILFHRTGDPPTPIVFDNFSPGDPPLCPPSVSITSSPWNKICFGESVELIPDVVGGTPPFTYQWQQETSPGTWVNLGALSTQTVSPSTTTKYHVIVTDAGQCPPASSPPFELPVCGPIYGTWCRDADGDGYGNPGDSLDASDQPAGYVADCSDCDDGCSTCHPGASEVEDGKDNDCDGEVDEGGGGQTLTWYRDADGDGFGNPNDSTQAAEQPQGYVSGNTDCDDDDADVHPGASEICDDGQDNDCDGLTDGEDLECLCGAGLCSSGVAGMLPFTLLGVFAMKRRTRRRQ